MATVYVVTKGCYSDYHICAVTLDKEKAEALRVLFNGNNSWDETCIEEFDTETYEDLLLGRKPYYVLFLKSGDLFSVTEDTRCIEYFEPGIQVSNVRKEGDKVEALKVMLYAENAEAAIKIAAEKRAMYLAEKEGIA